MSQAIMEKYGEARLPRYTSYPTAPHFAAMPEQGDLSGLDRVHSLDDGLIHMAAGTIRANEQYRFIVRYVAAALDAYLGKGGRAFSKAA